MTKRAFLLIIALTVLIVALLPVATLLLQSLRVDGHFSLALYRNLLNSVRPWTLLGHSLTLAALGTAITTAAGLPLGILLGKTDLPLRRFFTVLFGIPLLIPPYIFAVSWVDLLGNDGLLAALFTPATQLSLFHALFGLPGCTAVLSSIFLPVPLLLTIVFLKTIHPGLEEAALLTSGWPVVLRKITLPLILPGVLLAALLVFLLTFGEFSVPNFLRFDVYPVESFTQFSAFYDFQAATAAAVPLALVTVLLLAVEALFLRTRTDGLPATGGREQPPVISLGKWRYRIFAVVALAGTIVVIVPLAALVVRSDGNAFAEALRRAGDSLWRSLLYAAAGATLLAFFGFFTGYLVYDRTFRFWRALDSMTLFLLALPGTVIGIGLIRLWNTPRTNCIYATPLIIFLGYLAKYLALTHRISIAQLARISPSMEEAAQVAGAGWFRRMAWILTPLARRGLLAGWLAGFIFSLRDTGITMLVYPPGRETLPVRIFTLMANGSPPLIAALCLLMIGAILMPAGAIWALANIRRKGASA